MLTDARSPIVHKAIWRSLETNFDTKRMIKVKLLVLLLLCAATVGLSRATAEEICSAQSCVRVTDDRGRPVGYGCVKEGTIARKCTATLNGCTYDSCVFE
jgi:hypothetical protein